MECVRIVPKKISHEADGGGDWVKRWTQQSMVVLLLCLALIAVTILSAALVLRHAGHQCIGSGCKVCDQLRHTGHLFQQFSLLETGFLIATILFIRSFLALREAVTQGRNASPVRLKVRLNH